MIIIEKVKEDNFPFKWMDIEYYPNSLANKIECYIPGDKDLIENMIISFFDLFKEIKENIYIYNNSWWDFCLNTWDIKNDIYNYELSGKSVNCDRYLNMLKDSEIEVGFSGSCKCLNWNEFLNIIIPNILNHSAPYSPLFYSKKIDMFFYFHHSGSFGLYYVEENEFIKSLIQKLKQDYVIVFN